jgi:glucosamine--fructose-6-phosphate aminotransferase (isomerizing)
MDHFPAGSFDPTAPLDGAPDPWAYGLQPSTRSGPPYHMTEMIAAEPALAGRLLARLADPGSGAARLATAIREAAGAGLPVVLTGCGTSEHGAQGAAELLRDALRRAGLPHSPALPVSAQAFELALDPPRSGLVVGVSHEGGTWATNLALEAARTAGARVSVITASDRSPAAALADPGLVVATEELDHSWCHTVGYVSPLLVAAAVGAHLSGERLDAAAVSTAFAAGAADIEAIEALAEALGDSSRLLVVASGADRPAGRELVLKVEEGSWVPSAYRDLETVLHGHWPGTDASTGLVLVLADPAGREARVDRARQMLAAAAAIGTRAGAILSTDAAAALADAPTPAGRVVVPEQPTLPAPAAALFGTATALQLLTERLARVRGTDPDPIRRDDPVYREAAAIAEG